MQVASLELCRELYEVSGWESEHTWAEDGSNTPFVCRSDFSDLGHDSWRIAYAYDLSYLLRKLPHQIGGVTFDLLHHNNGHWVAHYVDHPSHVGEGDTPEDAACKLSIELFKSGVLHHED